MRRRSLITTSEPSGAVNATPLIDVVLCMIVFFLIVGKLASTRRAVMDLPESASGVADRPPEAFVINILPPADAASLSPRFFIDERETDIAEIPEILRARLERSPGLTVQVRAPRSAAYGMIEPAIEAAAAAGVRDVRLATDRVSDGASGPAPGVTR